MSKGRATVEEEWIDIGLEAEEESSSSFDLAAMSNVNMDYGSASGVSTQHEHRVEFAQDVGLDETSKAATIAAAAVMKLAQEEKERDNPPTISLQVQPPHISARNNTDIELGLPQVTAPAPSPTMSFAQRAKNALIFSTTATIIGGFILLACALGVAGPNDSRVNAAVSTLMIGSFVTLTALSYCFNKTTATILDVCGRCIQKIARSCMRAISRDQDLLSNPESSSYNVPSNTAASTRTNSASSEKSFVEAVTKSREMDMQTISTTL